MSGGVDNMGTYWRGCMQIHFMSLMKVSLSSPSPIERATLDCGIGELHEGIFSSFSSPFVRQFVNDYRLDVAVVSVMSWKTRPTKVAARMAF
jgi:hypothetical protein